MTTTTTTERDVCVNGHALDSVGTVGSNNRCRACNNVANTNSRHRARLRELSAALAIIAEELESLS